MELVSNEEVKKIIQEKNLTDWTLKDKEIEKQYTFKDFMEALDFVNKIAVIAEELEHHPDIRIVWNKVTFTISTHSAGGLTEKDFNLAEMINKA